MSEEKQARKEALRTRSEHLRQSKTLLSVLMLILCFAIIFGVFLLVASPKKYALKVGDIADETITATKDIEDTIATEKAREAARNSIVEGMTKLDASVSATVDDNMIYVLGVLTDARTDYRIASVQAMATPTPTPTPTPDPATLIPEEGKTAEATVEPTPAPTPAYNSQDVLKAAQGEILSALSAALDGKVELTEDQLVELLEAGESDFDTLCDVVLGVSREVMEEGIKEGALQSKLQSVHLMVLGRGIPNSLTQSAYAILDTGLKENIFIDETATEEERQEAADAVEPVIYKKGQNIVKSGEIVTEQQVALLSALGLLEDNVYDITMILGLAILTLLMLFLVLGYLLALERERLRNPKEIFLLVIVLLLGTGLCCLVKEINQYLAPMELAIIIVAGLLSQGLALVLTPVSGLIAGIVATGSEGIFTASMFQIVLMTVFGGSMAVYLSKNSHKRSALLYGGFAIALVNFIVMFSSGILNAADVKSTLWSAVYGAGGGLLSAVLAVGVMPLLESLFKLVTPQMLLELCNPTQPLLRMLQTEAPGTHHHCLLVANLAEAAADKVGANALLCRVGAYYHDVGKMRRPIFFKENQIDQPNPHNGLDPQVSAAILAAHVRDGVSMAEKYKLPRPVIDLIAQHHGDGLMAYFYFAAKKKAEESGEEVVERDFSYDGPKPQTKEAAILMLADTVEAAARTLKDRSYDNMVAFIEKLVKEKVESGQLAEAPLTFREISEISDAFIRTLAGIYHERIEYPDLKTLKK